MHSSIGQAQHCRSFLCVCGSNEYANASVLSLVQTLRLRGILEWRDEVTSSYDSASSDEVMILIWPAGHFKRLPRGTTASQVVRDQVSHLAVCSASHCIIIPIRFARLLPRSKPISQYCCKVPRSQCAEAFLSLAYPAIHSHRRPSLSIQQTQQKQKLGKITRRVCVCLCACSTCRHTRGQTHLHLNTLLTEWTPSWAGRSNLSSFCRSIMVPGGSNVAAKGCTQSLAQESR